MNHNSYEFALFIAL